MDGVWWVTPEQSGGAFNASFLMFSHKVLGCYFSQLPHSSWSQLYTPSLFGQLFSTEVSEIFLKFCFLLTVSLQVWLHAASTNLVQSDIFCHLSQSPLNLAFHKGLEEAHLEVTSCSSVTQTTTMWKLKSLAFTAQSLEFWSLSTHQYHLISSVSIQYSQTITNSRLPNSSRNQFQLLKNHMFKFCWQQWPHFPGTNFVLIFCCCDNDGGM